VERRNKEQKIRNKEGNTNTSYLLIILAIEKGCFWQLATGDCRLAIGDCRLAIGDWQLATGD
jgi:hypothetical protein